MSVWALIALLLPAVPTYGVIRWLGRSSDVPFGRASAAAVAPALGLGIASSVYFLQS